MNEQRVGDWMTPEPKTIHPDLGAGVAYQMMSLHDCRRLPVVNDDGELVGIVTMSDVREARPPRDAAMSVLALHYQMATTAVGDIMSSHPRTVEPSTTILDAARVMLERKVGGLPVLENGRLVGIITESDIFRFLVSALEQGALTPG